MENYDIVFLTETRHQELPTSEEWEVIGSSRGEADFAGGVLALVRQCWNNRVVKHTETSDGFLWVQ
eukprot:11945195-Karenia_brevis.AAC.1